MALYLIGDVQGCDAALQRLLEMGFSPSRDTLCCWATWSTAARTRWPCCAAWCAGRRAHAACWATTTCTCWPCRKACASRTATTRWTTVLAAPDREALLDWLRRRPLALHEVARRADGACRRAAVLDGRPDPGLAAEVEAVLRGPDCTGFLAQMYGNKPARWSDDAAGMKRLRGHRQRAHAAALLHAGRHHGFRHQGRRRRRARRVLPWFDVPGRRTAARHHGGLRPLVDAGLAGPADDVLSLDTGCVWGGCPERRAPVAGAGAAPGVGTHPGALPAGAAWSYRRHASGRHRPERVSLQLQRFRRMPRFRCRLGVGLEQRGHAPLGLDVGRDAAHRLAGGRGLPGGCGVGHGCGRS
jgi:bis(5'-nucleosyl)-tetraphosphatase (symmetrical)